MAMPSLHRRLVPKRSPLHANERVRQFLEKSRTDARFSLASKGLVMSRPLPPTRAAMLAPLKPLAAALGDIRFDELDSNEIDHHYWSDLLRARPGGGYFGVAGLQNYKMMSDARPTHAWLADVNPGIVDLHRIVGLALVNSNSPIEFVRAFAPESRAANTEFVAAQLGPKAAEVYASMAGLLFNYAWGGYFGHDVAPPKALYQARQANMWRGSGYEPAHTLGHFDFLSSSAATEHLRGLFLTGRIATFAGDLRNQETMQAVGTSARNVQSAFSNIYLSNVFSPEYRIPPREIAAGLIGLPANRGAQLLVTGLPTLAHQLDPSFSFGSVTEEGDGWLYAAANLREGAKGVQTSPVLTVLKHPIDSFVAFRDAVHDQSVLPFRGSRTISPSQNAQTSQRNRA